MYSVGNDKNPLVTKVGLASTRLEETSQAATLDVG